MDDSYAKGLTKFGDENYEFGSPNLQKPKKVAVKHRYMEPTLSAATKTAKKKILGERNQAFTFTNSSKPQILDSRTSPARSVRSSCGSDYDDDEDNSFDGNSSMNKPYDPLTNYLSPRPKFLRYNPDRKRRIILHGESSDIEKKEGSGVVSTTSSFESQKVVEEKTFEEGFVEEEIVEPEEKTGGDLSDHDDEVEETEEEFEEEEKEEQKCWSLLGLLKFLLILGSLFLSTSYICSMNSPNPSLIQEAIREFRYGFLNQSNSQEVAARKDYFTSELQVLGGKEQESPTSLPNVTVEEDVDVEFVEGGVSEVSWDDKELLASSARLPEVQIEKSEDVYDDGLISKVQASDSLQWAKALESEANTDVAASEAEASSEDVYDDGLMSKVEASDAFECAEATESETNTDVAASGAEVSLDQLSGSAFRENISARDQEMGGIQDRLDQLQVTETADVKDSFSGTEASTDFNAEFEHMESEEIQSQQLELAALVLLFTIISALGLLYYSRRRNSKETSLPTQKNRGEEEEPTEKNSGEEASLPIELHQTNVEPAHQIQNTNAICSVEEEYVQKVASFPSSSTPLLPSMNVVTGEFSRQRQRQAPIVELLGELVIGEETSSFVKSSKVTRIPDSEERNASNSHSTLMMKSRSKTSLVQNQVDPLELSTADSTSQKKKRPVKEEINGGEVSMSTATPVRRSSRIRNNKAMSP